ncbi:Uncharacterised protein [BD1-7 clade bacterium]|uniref:Phosphatidic acid phosphatase type 2/haloperoxidase domain-containing protein n=1 Tax=BD1-7 clade bacterium TaxID=2029982 RepID=A0A5S9NP28_9GAMM|nr:Uncharacterised protein [BD1-7 clade bacterium]
MNPSLWRPFLVAGVIATVLGAVSFLFFDRQIALLAHQWFAGTWIYLASGVIDGWTSSKQMAIVAMLIGLIGGWRALCDDPSSKNYLIVFVAYALAYLAAVVVKVVVARYRPDLWFSEGLYGFSWFSLAHETTSFPSGHSVVNFVLSFTLAMTCWKTARWLAILALCYGFAIAASRIILNAHYLGDVLGSMAVACFSISVVLSLVERQEKRVTRSAAILEIGELAD